MISQGWQPFGGVSMSQLKMTDGGIYYIYSQAMVQYEKAENSGG
ncbi:MAG: hypothetical protein GY832_23530 [Chloroflexi bacterium]|nr:hypothetical protein [Chloroflexota bacterium]